MGHVGLPRTLWKAPEGWPGGAGPRGKKWNHGQGWEKGVGNQKGSQWTRVGCVGSRASAEEKDAHPFTFLALPGQTLRESAVGTGWGCVGGEILRNEEERQRDTHKGQEERRSTNRGVVEKGRGRPIRGLFWPRPGPLATYLLRWRVHGLEKNKVTQANRRARAAIVLWPVVITASCFSFFCFAILLVAWAVCFKISPRCPHPLFPNMGRPLCRGHRNGASGTKKSREAGAGHRLGAINTEQGMEDAKGPPRTWQEAKRQHSTSPRCPFPLPIWAAPFQSAQDLGPAAPGRTGRQARGIDLGQCNYCQYWTGRGGLGRATRSQKAALEPFPHMGRPLSNCQSARGIPPAASVPSQLARWCLRLHATSPCCCWAMQQGVAERCGAKGM